MKVQKGGLAERNATDDSQACPTAADWKPAGMFGGKGILAGFTPGSTVWVRVRTCGLKGVMGHLERPGQVDGDIRLRQQACPLVANSTALSGRVDQPRDWL